MQSFYDHTEEQREALTLRSIAEKRSLTERWVSLGLEESSGWDTRAALAAKLLEDQFSVADLGCGIMLLEKHLDRAVGYYPIDIVARDKRTIVCDFNKEVLPETDAGSVACLGLLEYLLYPGLFLRSLAAQYPVAVISYCITDAPRPLKPRRAHGWVNDFSCEQLEQQFTVAGWEVCQTEMVDEVQRIWRLKRRPVQLGMHRLEC